jgi:hypothetical protein
VKLHVEISVRLPDKATLQFAALFVCTGPGTKQAAVPTYPLSSFFFVKKVRIFCGPVVIASVSDLARIPHHMFKSHSGHSCLN